jgi:HEAT repeat protein
MRTRHLVGLVPLLFGVWFFGTLAPYGLHVDEDGDLLYQMFATYRGQVPYIDFSSGYTPGFFYYHAALFRLFGVDALVVRISVAIANTLSVYLLYVLAARLLRPGLALLAPLLFVGSLLAFPGSFCAFNVPYPAWYNIALWLGSLVAVAAYVDHGRMRAVLLAGLLAGANFSVKPNIGLFNIAGLSVFLLWWHPPTADDNRLTRWAWWALAAATGCGVIAVFHLQLFAREFRLFPLPLLVLAAVLVINAQRSAGRAGFLRAALTLAAGLALPTLPWLVYFLFRLGLRGFLADVLMIGSPYEFFFFIAHRFLGDRWDEGLLLIGVGLVVAPVFVRRVRMPPWLLLAGGGAVAGAAVLYVARWAPMPEGFQAAVASRVHDLSFFILHAVNWVGIGIIAREATRDPNRRSRFFGTLVLIGVSATAMVLGLYPRSDFMHLLICAPASLILGTFLLARVVHRWRATLPDTLLCRRAADVLLVGPPVLTACVMVAPAVGLALSLSGYYLGLTEGELVRLDLPRASLILEPQNEHRFRGLRPAARYIEEHTLAQDFVFPFPSLNLLCFLSGRLNPARKGYFNPGFPDHGGEADIVSSLRTRVPRLVVSLHDHGVFIAAPVYYVLIRDFVATNYEPVARFGPYAILGRRMGPASAAQAPVIVDRAPASTDSNWLGLDDPDPAVQFETARHIREVRDPAGAAALARRAVRDDSPYRVLFLRIVGEFGDESAVPPLVQIVNDDYFSEGGQYAAAALFNIAGKALFENYWFTAQALQPRLQKLREQVDPEIPRAWLRDPDLDMRLRYAAAWLAAVLGDQAAAPYLTKMLENDPPGLNTTTAVYALARLGTTEEITQRVIDLMKWEDTFMPSILIDLYRDAPERVRPLIEEELRHGTGKQREMLAWVAAVLRDPAFMPMLKRQCLDGYEPVRKAAAWALEMLRTGGFVAANDGSH